MEHEGNTNQYKRLVIMIIASFISMYILMYAMVNIFANALPNLNQFYMAGIMTAPMVIIELLLMKAMYRNMKFNVWIIVATTAVFLFLFLALRYQYGVSDKQFLKSMIPHHAGAVLMCEQANLQDVEIRALCESIITGQQAEIDFMREKLNSL